MREFHFQLRVSSTDAELSGEVRDAAAASLAQFTAMTRAPDEVELKFGVKLDAEAGAIIARTGIHGQFEVKLSGVVTGLLRTSNPSLRPSSAPAAADYALAARSAWTTVSRSRCACVIAVDR